MIRSTISDPILQLYKQRGCKSHNSMFPVYWSIEQIDIKKFVFLYDTLNPSSLDLPFSLIHANKLQIFCENFQPKSKHNLIQFFFLNSEFIFQIFAEKIQQKKKKLNLSILSIFLVPFFLRKYRSEMKYYYHLTQKFHIFYINK